MLRLLVLAGVVLLAFAPPFFTGGACTAQFDRESARLESDRKLLASPELAALHLRERKIPNATLSEDQCRRAKPRNLASCPPGPLLIAKVPVENLVCRLYRDEEIRVQLHYDERNRLTRIVTEMNPFKSLPIPFTQAVLHWGR
ncbi:hypothetical protein [Usitatibacter palustris]|uniref:Uncharacterized protein n=1 Tax=Usitatibacter palustris TaxID=2732487 RepID=A0A6M4H832_9PROT|nr:hypothetical protein [Usitatibacter palustris]QJR15776.1 hypothetical protein DSM104440_02602 [Usitatibacter palustris]